MPRAPRFVIPLVGVATGAIVELPTPVAHQVTRVLRLRPGDPIELLDGKAGGWHATLDAGTSPARATATVGRAIRPSAADSGRHVTLVLGLLKSDKFDWVVQKATEIGVARIVPVITMRSVAMVGRPDRWRRIAVEATEQCGRTIVPTIDDPLPFRAAMSIGITAHDVRLACWEDEGTTSFQHAIGQMRRDSPAVVWVGPEGGISMEEAIALRESGVTTASLGPRILRSETAAIVAVAFAIGESAG